MVVLTASQTTTDQEIKKLDALVKKTQRRIFSLNSVFPFDLFPDSLNVDENKIDIVHREFFIIKHIFPVLLTNINSVTVTTNLFFATLTFEVSGYERNPEPVRMLWHKDAMRAKRIILGLIACYKEGIDISKIPTDELRAKVEEIGKAREHDKV